VTIRTFRVYIDETHLHGGQRILQSARMDITIGLVVGDEHRIILALGDTLRPMLVADIAAKPGDLGAPVHIVVRLPNILAAAAKTERFETHRLERDVARQDHQIGPRNLAPIFLLDRPQQSASFVEADVIGPAIERSKPLLTTATAATTVARPVSTGRV